MDDGIFTVEIERARTSWAGHPISAVAALAVQAGELAGEVREIAMQILSWGSASRLCEAAGCEMDVQPAIPLQEARSRCPVVGQFEFLLRLKESTNVHDA